MPRLIERGLDRLIIERRIEMPDGQGVPAVNRSIADDGTLAIVGVHLVEGTDPADDLISDRAWFMVSA